MAQVPIQGHWIHLLIVAIPLRSPLISNNALVFLAFYILTFLEYKPVILWNVHQLEFFWSFLLIKFKVYILGGNNITGVMINPSQCIILEGIWFPFLLVVVLTLVTCLRWYLPVLLKILFFPFVVKYLIGRYLEMM